MGKLLILSVTNGEEQILDRIKDFLAEEPGIEVVEPPAAKHTLTIPGLEPAQADGKVAGPASPPYAPGVLHAGLSGPAPRLDFYTGADLRGRMARVPGGLRRGRGQHHQPAPPEDGTGKPDPYRPPQRLQVRAAFCGLGARERVSSTIYAD